MTLRETYARDICQNPGVPLEDCPRLDEHYARADEVLAGLTDVQPVGLRNPDIIGPFAHEDGCAFAYGNLTYPCRCFVPAAAIVAALEDRA